MLNRTEGAADLDVRNVRAAPIEELPESTSHQPTADCRQRTADSGQPTREMSGLNHADSRLGSRDKLYLGDNGSLALTRRAHERLFKDEYPEEAVERAHAPVRMTGISSVSLPVNRGRFRGGNNMGGMLHVLLVEDSETDAKLLLRELRLAGFEPELERVETAETMHDALHRKQWDIVLSDFTMPRFSAPAAFALLRAEKFDIPFIIVSGTVGEDIAVQAMRLGVNDYVLKGKLTRLGPAIERELRECQAREASRRTELKLKRIEEQLRQAQKMEAIGRLAGGVAHDFNNVLSVIIGYTSMVLESLDSDAPFRPELEEVNRAAESGARLTRQLLAFSRHQVFEARSVSLNELLFGMERMLRRLLGEDLELVISADPRLDKIHADPGQIEQIVMNLAVNARDAMPSGGKLTIETSNVQLDAEYAAEHEGSAPGS
jgi:signal transduction histidine kinase